MKYEYRTVDTFQAFWQDRINANAAEGFRVVIGTRSHSSIHVLMEREVPDDPSPVRDI